MYESTLAGTLLYTWGANDYKNGRVGHTSLASEAQNPLDGLIGDLIGRAGSGRWFLAELKQEEAGFRRELRSKPKRKAFLAWLKEDDDDRRNTIRISTRAHFAIWQADGKFQFSEYISAANPKNFPPDAPTLVTGNKLPFSEFYDAVSDDDETLHGRYRELFASGLGVSIDTMLDYLEQLIRHDPESKDPKSEAAYLLLNAPPSGPMTHFTGNDFPGLLEELKQVKILTENSVPSAIRPKT